MGFARSIVDKFDEGGITNNEGVKIFKGITEDSDSVVVSFNFRNINGMLGVSDVGELGESRLGINLIFLVNTKINFGSG